MEEKNFKVDDRVVVLNPEAFAKIILTKSEEDYKPELGHCGDVIQVDEEQGTMELAIQKPTEAKKWWILVVKITTYIEDDRVFSDRPLGLVSSPPNISHFGNDIPPRSVSFKGTPGEIPHRTEEERKYLDKVWPDF